MIDNTQIFRGQLEAILNDFLQTRPDISSDELDILYLTILKSHKDSLKRTQLRKAREGEDNYFGHRNAEKEQEKLLLKEIGEKKWQPY